MRDDAVRDALLAALDEEPADPAALTALADWYEEHDDGAAVAALRWAARNQRRPGRTVARSAWGNSFWERQEAQPILNDPRAQLPEKLWNELKGNGEPHPVASFKSYASPGAAWLSLMAAWKSLGEPVADLE